MDKKLVYLLSFVLLLGLNLPVLAATFPGQLGIGIILPERGGTMVNQVHEHWRWLKAGGAYLTPDTVDASGWPTVDARYIVDWRPVAEWIGEIDDPEEYRIDMSGLYKSSFSGQAVLSWVEGDFAISNQIFNPDTNTTTFDITVGPPGPGHGLIVLEFLDTRRTPTSDLNTGITNFRMTRPGYAHDTTQVFTDAFINCLTSANFSHIRFMDFRLTNYSDLAYPDTVEWAERKLVTDAGQGRIEPLGKLDGAAWEYVIKLANQANMHPWITIRVSATADYVTQLATLFKNNLNADLNVYVESSNEVWNTMFDQTFWNQAQAATLELANHENHARRTVELAQIFEGVFGAESLNNRVRVMLCYHMPLYFKVNEMLYWIDATYGPPNTFIYSIASQTYFKPPDPVPGAPDRSIDTLFEEARADIENQLPTRRRWVALADRWDLPGGWSSYEGGPHFPHGGIMLGLENKILAHRDERMGTLMKYNLNENFFALGGNLAMQFTLTSGYHRYGCWGLTDDVTIPDRNYKFQAMRDLVGNGNQCHPD